MHGAFILPDGPRGRLLAAGVSLAALMLLLFTVLAPLWGWYEARATQLAQMRAIAAHMEALGREIPELKQAVSGAGLQPVVSQVLLAGDNDTIAGANLQSALQNLASQAGASLDSIALRPARQAGPLRRIEVQVSMMVTWPVLIALLQAIGAARPYMVVDQISITRSSNVEPGVEQQMSVDLSVAGFRPQGA